MKTTNRTMRIDTAGRHNDRNYDTRKTGYIDSTRSINNKYWCYDGSEVSDDNHFKDVEMKFYKENFQESLDLQNEKHKKARNYNRIKKIENIYKAKYTRPEDQILQIGKMGDSVDPELLWECALEYQRRLTSAYGEHIHILTMALHVDEVTPHIHIRRTWTAENRIKGTVISETQALRQMGFDRPDKDKPEGRFNNIQQSFTEYDQMLWMTICKEKGLDIEKGQEDLDKQHRLSLWAYKKQQDDKSLHSFCNSIYKALHMTVFKGKFDEEVEYEKTRPLMEQVDYCEEKLRHEISTLLIPGHTLEESLVVYESLSDNPEAAEEIKTQIEFLRSIHMDGLFVEQFKEQKEKKRRVLRNEQETEAEEAIIEAEDTLIKDDVIDEGVFEEENSYSEVLAKRESSIKR